MRQCTRQHYVVSVVTLFAFVPDGVLANVFVLPGQKPSGSAVDVQQPRALMLYDCQADFLDMVRAWSPEKMGWCCSRSGLACKQAVEVQTQTVVLNAGFSCAEG